MPFVIWKAKQLDKNNWTTPDTELPSLGISYRILSSKGNLIQGGSVLAHVDTTEFELDGFEFSIVSEQDARNYILENVELDPDSALTKEEVVEATINPSTPSAEELATITS
jgi:hypothetical protein